MSDLPNQSTEGQTQPVPTTPRPEPVCFDDRQQAKVNELIRQKQGEAAASLRRQLKEKEGELARTKTALFKTEAALRKSSESTAATAAELLEERRQHELQEATKSLNFYDHGDVVKLTQQNIKYNEVEGRFYVTNEDGEERLNENLAPMTLTEYYSEFARKSPHLVKGTVRPGTNAGESQRLGPHGPKLEELFGPDSDARKADELYRRDAPEYRRKKILARSRGLI